MRRIRPGVALIVLAIVVSWALVLAAAGPSGAPQPSASADAAAVASTGASPSISPPASPSPSPSVEPSPSAELSPSPSPTPSGEPGPPADVPIVPVTSFRSPVAAATIADAQAALAGTSTRYEAVELVSSDADAILAALGAARPLDPKRLIEAADAGTLAADMAAHRKRLGFLRADEVGPSVRALAWGGESLFGVDREPSLDRWPLRARLPATLPGVAPFDPAITWTMVAGGDILLDRGVAKAVTLEGKGVDFPFDGGTAAITGRYCCSSFGWELPRLRRTGHAGALRHLLEAADLAVANFENPAPDAYRYHTHGTVFSANPALIAGLRDAGIDVVSIGNNHIRDAGGQSVIETRRNLAKYGIEATGAGSDAAEARRPADVTVAGIKVAILGYDTIAKSYAAGPERAGSAQLSTRVVAADIATARANGADLVIVYPHWGIEYRARPFDAQQRLAHAVIDAGADIVIGNHAHWAGAMEIYKGRPIWYALGNFVFDQTWSEPTMEGITLELTFRGASLAQVRMRPHVILDGAQPNFLDPAGDGKLVMGQVFGASRGLLPW